MTDNAAARGFTMTVLVALGLASGQGALAASDDLAPLEGRWGKLPVACGSGSGATCGGDHFTIHAGVLDARKTCQGVQLVARGHRDAAWHVDVVGDKACLWNKQRVRSFVFSLRGPRLDFVAFAGPSAERGAELFQGLDFQRD